MTQYSVDESIETYWNRVVAQAKKEVAPNPPVTLAETFKEFLETHQDGTLLLLGEAGLGKTLTTYQWGDQLLAQWWAHMNTGTSLVGGGKKYPEAPLWLQGSHNHPVFSTF